MAEVAAMHWPDHVETRIAELIALYSAPEACVATLLCDRHDPHASAHRLIAADLSCRDITYGELAAESMRFAGALQALGITPGDRVATLMGKSREYLVSLLGIWRLGAVHVPLFTAFAPPAIALRLMKSDARAVICDAAQRPKLFSGEAMPANPPWRIVTTGKADDEALAFHALMAGAQPLSKAHAAGGDGALLHIHTSGTTGEPKGVVVPVRALASFHAYMEFGLGVCSDDVFWCAADPGWAYGLYYGVIGTFLTGVRSILFESAFSPQGAYAILDGQGVTNFAAAPTVYRALRGSGLSVPGRLKLRCASSAGEPLTPEVNAWAESRLGVTVHDHYGQTEAGMLINNHHHPALRRPVRPGSMGHEMPGWRLAVLKQDRDEEAPAGELGRLAIDLAASPLAWFAGYHGNAEGTAEKFSADARWYFTGDTASRDADGYFHFSARDDDIILMAGYRIGPFEVESAIVTHPAVAEAAVIAVPDDLRGEVIEAYVVLRSGHAASQELAAEICQWVKTHYAAHAYPRRVHFADALPKTPSGKLQRYVLRQQRRAELASEGKRD
ncbi:MAG: AMP-binding protein [Novosphingobium sp.]|nr:AMP-binding protein [Novosphingobium sp.]